MKPTYFDLSVSDTGRARTFFEKVLGWRFEKFEMPYEYYRISAGLAEQPGIDGGMGSVHDAPLSGGKPLTVLTVPVSDIESVLRQVVASGGTILEPPVVIPGIGRYATCAEPGGLMFGLIQADAPSR